MKGLFASILVAGFLVLGIGVGFLANASVPRAATVTETHTYTFTYTYTTTLAGLSQVEECVVTQYEAWLVGYGQGGYPTSFSTSTQSYPFKTFQTTTSPGQTVGYSTATSSTYTGTLTGALARWNSTVCTFV